MTEFVEWMGKENDTGFPIGVLVDPKSGAIVAKPRISVFSKDPVGPVNLVAPIGDEAAEQLAEQFSVQLAAEHQTIGEQFDVAREADENAPEPALLTRGAFDDTYLPMEPGEPPEESTPTAEPEVVISDAAVKLAEEAGIDLDAVEGSGAGGAIIVSDIEKAIKSETEAGAKAEAEAEAETKAEQADANLKERRKDNGAI